MTIDPHQSAETSEPLRLYGLPHAEHMYLDVVTLYETEIDACYDEDDTPEGGWTVEEWSVADPLTLLPKAEWFLEHLEESLCEEHTHEDQDCHHIFTNPQVLAAAERLREVIAHKVTWQQAEKHLGNHTLTLVDGEPHLDGEPLYRPAQYDGRDGE